MSAQPLSFCYFSFTWASVSFSVRQEQWYLPFLSCRVLVRVKWNYICILKCYLTSEVHFKISNVFIFKIQHWEVKPLLILVRPSLFFPKTNFLGQFCALCSHSFFNPMQPISTPSITLAAHLPPSSIMSSWPTPADTILCFTHLFQKTETFSAMRPEWAEVGSDHIVPWTKPHNASSLLTEGNSQSLGRCVKLTSLWALPTTSLASPNLALLVTLLSHTERHLFLESARLSPAVWETAQCNPVISQHLVQNITFSEKTSLISASTPSSAHVE